ncbi:Uncharacterised protein [Mycobacteroides abscessus subsp. abscessus]|nr:Uncharacterised protein [Mycobacteroides abscessus subsp. abscessus]
MRPTRRSLAQALSFTCAHGRTISQAAKIPKQIRATICFY